MCAVGIFGDREIGYVCAAMSYTLLLINLIGLIPQLRMRDAFGVVMVRDIALLKCSLRCCVGKYSHQFCADRDIHILLLRLVYRQCWVIGLVSI